MMRLDRSHGSRWIKSRVLTQSFSFLPLWNLWMEEDP